MINLHVTKKLLAKLPIDEGGMLPGHLKSKHRQVSGKGVDGPLSNWHANLVTIQRRNCVFLIHDETRFPVFIPGLLKADFAGLDWHFDSCFINTLLKCGATQEQLEAASDNIGFLKIDSQCDRSVQATMNRMIQETEHSIIYNQVNVAEITGHRVGAWLADRPCNVKGRKDCIWPKREMLALLDKLS